MPPRQPAPVARLTSGQVLAWRMARQRIHPVGDLDVPATLAAMAGAQAQVQSFAELSVALRRRRGRVGEAMAALERGEIVRTWAMRGTLHLFEPRQAAAILALISDGRHWERPAWQRYYGLGHGDMERVIGAVQEALSGRVLSREQLIEEVAQRTGSRELVDHMRSGWGGVLKPLASLGHLCNGPADAGRVTFTRPDTWVTGWAGLPPVDEAARVAVPAYLAAHGPATPRAFHAWLGYNRRPEVMRWFEVAGDLLAPVSVDGELAYARAQDIDELRDTRAARAIRMLAGFDHYLLGPGTGDTRIVAAARRAQVSRTAGWISPAVLAGGRVAGVWRLDGDTVTVTPFAERRAIADAHLAGEVRRVARALGRQLSVSIAA